MTEEQERAKFEHWAFAQLAHDPTALRRRDASDSIRFGEYVNEHLQRCWLGWQARAALSQPASPAPDAPTDEQLIGLAEKHHVWSKYGLEDAPKLLSFCRDVLALSQRNPASPAAPDEGRI